MRARSFAFFSSIAFGAVLFSPQAKAAHPHLYFDSAELDQAKTLVSQSAPDSLGVNPSAAISSLIQKAHSYAQGTYSYTYGDFSYTFSSQAPVSPADGFPYWTALFQEKNGSISERLQAMAYGWALTGDQQLLDGAVSMAMSLAAWPRWNDPNYNCACQGACLDNAHATMAMSFVYDVCYDALSEAQRTTLRQAILRNGTVPLASAVQCRMGASSLSNLDAILATGLGVGASALIDEDSRAQGWLSLSYQLAERYLDAQGQEGGLLEGTLYGAYALDNMTRLLESGRRQGAQDLLSHPVFEKLMPFAAATTASEGHDSVNFGDAGRDAVYFGQSAFYLVYRKQLPLARWYLGMSHQGAALNWVTIPYYRDDVTPEAPPLGASVFRDNGHATMRSGYDENSVFVAFKSGPQSVEVSHNHKDQNSLILERLGEWPLADYGYRNSTTSATMEATTGTGGHNTLLVQGSGQDKRTGGLLGRAITTPALQMVEGEAAHAYASGQVSQYQRQVYLVGNEYVLLRDEIVAQSGSRLALLFSPWFGGAVVAEPSAGRIETGRTRLRIESFADSPMSYTVRPFADAPELPPRLFVSADQFSPGPLNNANFESGLDHWTPRSTTLSAHSADSSQAHQGQSSAKISFATADAGYFYSEPFSVSEGRLVRAKAFLRTDNVEGRGARLRILFLNGTSYVSDAPAPFLTGTDDWTEQNITGTVPPGCNSARIALELTGKGTAWFDDVGLEISSGQGPGSLNATTVLYPLGKQGLLADGGFEFGGAGWTRRAPTIAQHGIDTSVVHSGLASGRIRFDSGSGAGYFYGPRYSAPAAGTAVHASAFIRTSNVSGNGARVRILFFKTGGGVSDAHASYRNGTSDFTEQTLDAVIPDGIEELQLALEFDGQGTAWFDDASFEVGDLGTPRGETEAPQIQSPVSQGLIIRATEHRELVAFPPGEGNLSFDSDDGAFAVQGEMGLASLDAQGRVRKGFLLDAASVSLGEALKMEVSDGKAASAGIRVQQSQLEAAVDGLGTRAKIRIEALAPQVQSVLVQGSTQEFAKDDAGKVVFCIQSSGTVDTCGLPPYEPPEGGVPEEDGSVPDGASSPDGGAYPESAAVDSPAGEDAEVPSQDAAPASGESSDAGCSCNMAPRAASPGKLLALLGIMWFWLRRRR